MPNALSAEQMERLVEIMREDVPRPVVNMPIREYHLATVRHDFINALARLADETALPADKEN